MVLDPCANRMNCSCSGPLGFYDKKYVMYVSSTFLNTLLFIMNSFSYSTCVEKHCKDQQAIAVEVKLEKMDVIY